MNTKNQFVYEQLSYIIDKLSIAKYIKNETKKFIQNLNYYKLTNIKKNIDVFIKFILNLNKNNSQYIDNISTHTHTKTKQKIKNQISYYYFNTNINPKDKKIIEKKIQSNYTNVINYINNNKGSLNIFLEEYGNATPTRITLNWLLKEKK